LSSNKGYGWVRSITVLAIWSSNRLKMINHSVYFHLLEKKRKYYLSASTLKWP
jgi:hypothetical protein